ncbi:MAG: DUF4911 domain-containing protein [Desulfovibrionaceae bacterium]|nr:DUF4911 domain-containing protein [Desulfovibrionaceae bacterium]
MRNIYIPILIAPHNIALCKYYIEAQDNIGYLRVLNPKLALLHAVTSPYQEDEMREFLYDISTLIPITFIDSSF